MPDVAGHVVKATGIRWIAGDRHRRVDAIASQLTVLSAGRSSPQGYRAFDVPSCDAHSYSASVGSRLSRHSQYATAECQVMKVTGWLVQVVRRWSSNQCSRYRSAVSARPTSDQAGLAATNSRTRDWSLRRDPCGSRRPKPGVQGPRATAVANCSVRSMPQPRPDHLHPSPYERCHPQRIQVTVRVLAECGACSAGRRQPMRWSQKKETDFGVQGSGRYSLFGPGVR